MADDRVRVTPTGSLRRINLPSPNPDLADWLMGAECKELVADVTTQIYAAYAASLPASKTGQWPGSGQQHLRRGAGFSVQRGGWGEGGLEDRWFGYVYNDALSYRSAQGEPYPAVIEYGNKRRGIPGGHQLRNAAHRVAASIGADGGTNLPGISRAERGRGSKLRGAGGRFVRNPLNRD